jgi:hypothetical protein
MKTTGSIPDVPDEVTEAINRVCDRIGDQRDEFVVEAARRILERGAAAEIRALPSGGGPRPIGLAAGEFMVPDDFDDPLPDDLIDMFDGK